MARHLDFARGLFADVTIFDPRTVIDRSTYEPFQYNKGIAYVVVNGEIVLERGRHTGPGGPAES